VKAIVRKVMSDPSLCERPPVLIDLGASGDLPLKWNLLAPYSICVAFDADSRDFSITESQRKGWKKLYSMNRLVAINAVDELDFYFTRSPYCSSSLQPNNKALEPWSFSQLFDVEKVVRLPATDLYGAINKIGVEYIDWYKSDTQGTDLRIFDSLPKDVLKAIIVAEFEPGIIDAYLGEDKLHHLMAYMDKQPFWISHMNVKGTQRIDQSVLEKLNLIQRKSLGSFLKIAPGWCEISYINLMENNKSSRREWLLAWVFSSIIGEHGFALHIAKEGAIKFNDLLFDELYANSQKFLSCGYLKFLEKVVSRVLHLAKTGG
jgi:hypothetical protein